MSGFRRNADEIAAIRKEALDMLARHEASPRTAIELISDERLRQATAEGWSDEHDDEHDLGELARAASCYAMPDGWRDIRGGGMCDSPALWPWHPSWWKPCPDDRIRELVKAGALIVAEIERLRRIP